MKSVDCRTPCCWSRFLAGVTESIARLHQRKTATALLKISVVGPGYIGTARTARFVFDDGAVVGIGVNQEEVDELNAWAVPIVEPQLPELGRRGERDAADRHGARARR